MRATQNGVILAASARCSTVEGNHYFPIENVNRDYQQPADAVWYYPPPSAAAAQIAEHVASWSGVRVERVRDASPSDRQHPYIARLLGRRADSLPS